MAKKIHTVPMCKGCNENEVGPISFNNPKGELCINCSHKQPDLPPPAPMKDSGTMFSGISDEELSDEFYRRRLHLAGVGGA